MGQNRELIIHPNPVTLQFSVATDGTVPTSAQTRNAGASLMLLFGLIPATSRSRGLRLQSTGHGAAIQGST